MVEPPNGKIPPVDAGVGLAILVLLVERLNEKIPLVDAVVGMAEIKASALPNIFVDF